jgi:hypothetical protein
MIFIKFRSHFGLKFGYCNIWPHCRPFLSNIKMKIALFCFPKLFPNSKNSTLIVCAGPKCDCGANQLFDNGRKVISSESAFSRKTASRKIIDGLTKIIKKQTDSLQPRHVGLHSCSCC